MGDILSKLKMVSEKVGVTETAHTIEEQIDLISESLDKVPASTNIAEALDDLSEVAQNINGGGETIEISMTIDKTTLAYTTDVSYQDAAAAINTGNKLSFNITTDGQTYTTDKYLYVENGSSAYMFLIYVLTNDFSYITWTGIEEQFTGTSMNGLVDHSGK